MIENLIYSINTVVPIFLIVILGRLLKKFGFLEAAFFAGSDKFVFNIALPVMLFLDLAEVESLASFDFGFIMFCCGMILCVFILLCIIVPIFCRDNGKRGALIQGIYRSNFAILGVSVIGNMFGEDAVHEVTILLPFAIILFNILAVIVLSAFAPENKKMSGGKLLKTILLNIAKNPLVIALLIGSVFLAFRIKLPTVLSNSLNNISNATLALALMSLGANIEPQKLKENFVPSFIAALCKTVVVPLICVTVAVVAGYRGTQLGIILILFASPTAVSSYIMAKNMGSDHSLAAQILLFSTVACMFTLFLEIFAVKSLGLI